MSAAPPSSTSSRRLIYISSDLGSITLRSDPSYIYYHVPSVAYRISKAALDMLVACQHVELKDKGFKVFAFNPGFVVTDLTGAGEEQKEAMRSGGAGDPQVSASGLLKVVEGERDADVGKLLSVDGVHPW